MNVILWVGVVALAVFVIWLIVRIRRWRRPRLISLVAFLRKPKTLDPAVLARIAGKVWNADLGNGAEAGDDGFVSRIGPVCTIWHEDRMYLMNSVSESYVEGVEDFDKAAESIGNFRSRQLFLQHRAWFSCDAIGATFATSAEEIAELYRRLAKLFAEYLDENCLLIYIPDLRRGFPVNDDTKKSLRSDDPLAALLETATVPLTAVSSDDPLMREAVAKARSGWPKFTAAFEAEAGERFSCKAPVSHSGNTEFIWIEVTALEGNRIFGKLANDPANLGPLKLGSKVEASVADLNDWCYIDSEGDLQGGFTMAVVQKASRKRRKKK